LDDHFLKVNDDANAAAEQQQDNVSVLRIDPIPLSQAIDVAQYEDCWYFVRYLQSSKTIHHVDGMAENLWKYCDHADKATELIDDGYKGTTKSPKV
jgi:hypothetical protein